MTKEELKEIIRKYEAGEDTGYTDEEYDALLEKYLEENGGESARPYSRDKQSDTINSLVCTLPKVYGVTTPMRQDQKTYVDWIKRNGLTSDDMVVIQPKFDGCSVALDFDKKKFFTRGDFELGESVDVTELFMDRYDRFYENRMTHEQYSDGVKFEVIIDVNNFIEYNRIHRDKMYRRPRDFVAAALKSGNKDMVQCLSMVPLRNVYKNDEWVNRILEYNGALITSATNYDTIQKFIDNILSNGVSVTGAYDYCNMEIYDKINAYHSLDSIPNLDVRTYQVDGVVVSLLDGCNIKDHKEVAIKIIKDIRQTKLKDVKYQVGKTGKITPVGILEPVKFDNITVDHVTLSTFDRVHQMNLHYNDTVDIMYNIVPYFVGTVGDGNLPIKIPTHCPVCKSPLDTRMLKVVRCMNINCPAVMLGGIVRYCQQMGIMGISDSTIDTFFENGILSDIAGLYKIKPSSIEMIPRYGKQSEQNILASIKNASENVDIARWFGAMPINDISYKTWKNIFDVLSKEYDVIELIKKFINENNVMEFFEVLQCNAYKFDNIGEVKLRNIGDGLFKRWSLICDTFPYITFNRTTTNDNIKGQVTLTGIHSKDIIKELNDHGWEVVDFNRNVKYVITKDQSFTSSTVNKARQNNIPIITIDELSKIY